MRSSSAICCGVRPFKFDKDTYDIDRKDKLVRRASAENAGKKWE